MRKRMQSLPRPGQTRLPWGMCRRTRCRLARAPCDRIMIPHMAHTGSMRVGYQTIIWGPRPRSVPEMLDAIQQAGYQGVEFFQRPQVLGDIDTLLQQLAERELELIGLSGGSLPERMEFCKHFRHGYLYVERWDEDAERAAKQAFKVALQPHLYKMIHRVSDAEQLLEAHPELWFVPDTAHLTIAGDDPAEAIRKLHKRVIAVHLKDWTPEYGRAPHRYARGFVELGEGIIKLQQVLEALRDVRFDRWLVVEQDYTRTDPVTSARMSASWLIERGVLSKPAQERARPASPPSPPEPVERLCDPRVEARFLSAVTLAGTGYLDDCWRQLCKAFFDLIPSDLVSVWTCSQAKDLMMLLAIEPKPLISPDRATIDYSRIPSGDTVANQFVTIFDLGDPRHRNRFSDPALLTRIPSRWMVSLPIMNPWNPAHVWLLVNFFRQTLDLPLTTDELFELGRHAGIIANFTVTDFCSWAGAKVASLVREGQREREFLELLVGVIRETLECEGVTIFTLNEAGDRLYGGASTGMQWFGDPTRNYYQKGEGLVGTIWARNEVLLTRDARMEGAHWGHSEETVPSPGRHECLYAPLVTETGDFLGVVRCRNRCATRPPGTSSMFTDEDAAALDAIVHAALAQLQVLRNHESRITMLGRLTHELRVPVSAIRNTASCLSRMTTLEQLRRYDYLGHIRSWTELMDRLIRNADVLRASGPIELHVAPTLLMGEVIAPTKLEMKLLLDEREFDLDKIRYDSFQDIPRLYVDRDCLQQVVFNLLANSIKYAHDDPSGFQIEIASEHRPPYYAIYFRDWGPGVPEGIEERIFEEGFRDSKAAAKHIGGQGLGLWVVRRIVEAHRGKVNLTNNRFPCEFTLLLPDYLRYRGPDPPPSKIKY